MAQKSGSILVVDDEQVVLKSCQRILAPEGYEVTCIDSPEEALGKYRDGSFDLVISDIMMPGMGGLEFVRQLRGMDPDASVIVITGYPSQESIKEALGLRIIDYLPKPFSPSLLLEMTENALAMKKKGAAPTAEAEEYNEETAAKLDAMIAKYRHKPGSLIPVLQHAQGIVGYLPPVVQRHIARSLNIPVSEVHGVVSFYSFFSMKPRGKHSVKVCLGTACYVKRAEEILGRLKQELGIGIGEVTPDKQFSMESVRCLGACGLAPVVVIDQETYGGLDPKDAPRILEQYRN